MMGAPGITEYHRRQARRQAMRRAVVDLAGLAAGVGITLAVMVVW